jgi:hypothetical protein
MSHVPAVRHRSISLNFDNHNTGGSEDEGLSAVPQELFASPLPMESRPNPLAVTLSNLIEESVKLTIDICRQLYTKSSVIILSAGLAGGVHYLACQYSPIASAAIDSSFDGSMALAKYVGLAFLIHVALQPIHQKFTKRNETGRINAHVVRYLTPMALAWIVAYQHGIPVKFAAATLYTLGTFAAIKLLNKGFESALEWIKKL